MSKVIGTNDFRDALINKFTDSNVKQASKSEVVQKLYNKYKKSLTQPKMNTQNLITAIRYIKKNNLKQNEYQKVIDKTATKTSALTLSQFADIYDYVLKSRNVEYTLNRKNILRVYNWILDDIRKIVNNGDRLRLSGLGSFEGATRQARVYRIPRTNKTTKVGKHLVPKFYASPAWKHELRNKK